MKIFHVFLAEPLILGKSEGENRNLQFLSTNHYTLPSSKLALRWKVNMFNFQWEIHIFIHSPFSFAMVVCHNIIINSCLKDMMFRLVLEKRQKPQSRGGILNPQKPSKRFGATIRFHSKTCKDYLCVVYTVWVFLSLTQ